MSLYHPSAQLQTFMNPIEIILHHLDLIPGELSTPHEPGTCVRRYTGSDWSSSCTVRLASTRTWYVLYDHFFSAELVIDLAPKASLQVVDIRTGKYLTLFLYQVRVRKNLCRLSSIRDRRQHPNNAFAAPQPVTVAKFWGSLISFH